MKKLVVIESPYAGNIEENIEYAKQCMLDSLQRGESPLASHLLYTQVLDDANEEQRAQGIQAGLDWAYLCDYAVFYIDRGWSKGMLQAKEFYKEHLIPYLERKLILDK